MVIQLDLAKKAQVFEGAQMIKAATRILLEHMRAGGVVEAAAAGTNTWHECIRCV